MLKKIFNLTLPLVLALVPFFFVSAQGNIEVNIEGPLKPGMDVWDVLNAFLRYLVELGVVAVTLAIIYAGFLFVVARGNPEQLNKAKVTFFWTIVGALVLLGAQILSEVVQSTIQEINSEDAPISTPHNQRRIEDDFNGKGYI